MHRGGKRPFRGSSAHAHRGSAAADGAPRASASFLEALEAQRRAEAARESLAVPPSATAATLLPEAPAPPPKRLPPTMRGYEYDASSNRFFKSSRDGRPLRTTPPTTTGAGAANPAAASLSAAAVGGAFPRSTLRGLLRLRETGACVSPCAFVASASASSWCRAFLQAAPHSFSVVGAAVPTPEGGLVAGGIAGATPVSLSSLTDSAAAFYAASGDGFVRRICIAKEDSERREDGDERPSAPRFGAFVHDWVDLRGRGAASSISAWRHSGRCLGDEVAVTHLGAGGSPGALHVLQPQRGPGVAHGGSCEVAALHPHRHSTAPLTAWSCVFAAPDRIVSGWGAGVPLSVSVRAGASGGAWKSSHSSAVGTSDALALCRFPPHDGGAGGAGGDDGNDGAGCSVLVGRRNGEISSWDTRTHAPTSRRSAFLVSRSRSVLKLERTGGRSSPYYVCVSTAAPGGDILLFDVRKDSAPIVLLDSHRVERGLAQARWQHAVTVGGATIAGSHNAAEELSTISALEADGCGGGTVRIWVDAMRSPSPAPTVVARLPPMAAANGAPCALFDLSTADLFAPRMLVVSRYETSSSEAGARSLPSDRMSLYTS